MRDAHLGIDGGRGTGIPRRAARTNDDRMDDMSHFGF
jgi:hypothetical protein